MVTDCDWPSTVMDTITPSLQAFDSIHDLVAGAQPGDPRSHLDDRKLVLRPPPPRPP
jgi:hypothetical protein